MSPASFARLPLVSAGGLWPPDGPRSVVVRVVETTAPARAALCAQVRRLLGRGDVDVVTCDVVGVAADLSAIDALARLQLIARRLGGRIRLRGAAPEVSRLVDFAGVGEVLPPASTELGR